MDPTEDLSARVLLKHILSTDPPRTPITRSSVAPRRSSRLGEKDAGAKTPQDLLRRSLRQKLRESITRKSLPAPKRRTTSTVLRKSTSMLFDDGDTPRHILMNILRTDPVRSPVVHEKAASEEPQPSSANSSIRSRRSSIEISGLSLPDITIGNAASTVKGLSRKRPRRSLNVTAFEKRLKHGTDISEENEESVDDHSSLSLSSSTSTLSLKIPFGDARTEKRGLQRRVSNRRKITEEEFGAAVDKRQMGEVKSFVMAERGLSDTTYSEGFTLGLSKLSEPNITSDIVHCDTALYAQPEAMTSSFSMVAPQDDGVMASQLQRQLVEVEQEEPMEAEQSKLAEEASAYLFPTEEGAVAEPQNEECFSQSEEDVDAAESKKEERKSTAGGQPEDAAAMSKSEEDEAESQTRITDDTAPSEEKEKTVGAQTEEESDTDSQAEEDAATRSQSEEEEADSQTEEEAEGGVDSQFEDDAATRSQSEEEEGTADSQQEEEGGVDSQFDDDAATRSQSEEEKGTADSQEEEEEVVARSQSEEEEGTADSQEEEEGGVDSQFDDDAATRSQSEEEEGTADSHQEEEEGGVDSQFEDDVAARSEEEEEEEDEGAVAVYQNDQEDPAEGGLTDSQPEDEHDDDDDEEVEEEDDEQTSGDLEGGLEHISQRTRFSGGGVMSVIKATEADGEHLNDNRPEEAAAEDPAEQEEEWEEEEEEESEEVPSKTPAFVREKRKMFYSDPLASPSVLKNAPASNSNEDLPAAKPKQVRKRAGPAKREAGLPKSYLMNVFKHFAKTKVSADVYPVLQQTMDKFFERLAADLEAYAHHAKRKTIEVEDAELLLKRQGYVNDKVPVEVLIEKYLRLDQRKLLIPIATSGNVVIPKKRR